MLNKIAIFDSGVGGLGTLKLLVKSRVAKEIIYYADNKNVPFGTK
ncbi:glutamate racemase, partial [Campylobacter sp. RM9331]|nr:glutamate racemase [Campylobacter sp. RM9331]